MRYGTLICDLERSQPIELLPDRSAETAAAWLQKHPSIPRSAQREIEELVLVG
jgi:transposase